MQKGICLFTPFELQKLKYCASPGDTYHYCYRSTLGSFQTPKQRNKRSLGCFLKTSIENPVTSLIQSFTASAHRFIVFFLQGCGYVPCCHLIAHTAVLTSVKRVSSFVLNCICFNSIIVIFSIFKVTKLFIIKKVDFD